MTSSGLRSLDKINNYNNKFPLISIITVVYNAKTFLEKTIQSVINQTYSNIEYIIIDGNSSDGTLEIIKKYEDRINYWQSEPDKGIYDAMNKGISFASGDYIHFLNAGDIYVSNAVVENVVEEIIKTEFSYDIYYGYHIPCKKIQKRFGSMSLFLGRTICHQSIFAHKNTFVNNLFDINYKIVADRKWLFFCNKNKNKFRYIPIKIVIMDQTGVSSDWSRFYVEFRKLFFEEYGLLGSLILDLKNIPHILLKTIKGINE